MNLQFETQVVRHSLFSSAFSSIFYSSTLHLSFLLHYFSHYPSVTYLFYLNLDKNIFPFIIFLIFKFSIICFLELIIFLQLFNVHLFYCISLQITFIFFSVLQDVGSFLYYTLLYSLLYMSLFILIEDPYRVVFSFNNAIHKPIWCSGHDKWVNTIMEFLIFVKLLL